MKLRHGDVILTKGRFPEYLKPIPARQVGSNPNENFILAEGEVTGHAHRISEGEVELYERDGTLYLRVLSETAALTHEEHHRIDIPKGDWVVRIQREYEPDGWRYVAD